MEISGAHINPAVSVGLAVAGEFPWERVPGYITAQMAGGILGRAWCIFFYKPHYDTTDASELKRAPSGRSPAFAIFR